MENFLCGKFFVFVGGMGYTLNRVCLAAAFGKPVIGVYNMDSREKYEYWLDTAHYDLATAETMLATGRWVYVAFMCQQAIEKLVKGLYVLYIDDNVPKTHNIPALVERIDTKFPELPKKEYYDLFDELTMYYLNGRYTNYKQKVGEHLHEKDAKNVLNLTREAFAWLLTMKP